jgi:hypothetical protein
MTPRPSVRVAAPGDRMPPGHAEYEADGLNALTPDPPAGTRQRPDELGGNW